MEKGSASAKWKRTLLIIISVIVAVAVILLIVGVAYMENLLNLINKNPDDSTISQEEYQDFLNQTEESDPDFTGPTLDPEDVDWEQNDEVITKQEHIINILLIGQDRRPGQGRQRSDVMLLCTVNTKTKELTMTSFLRDLYVPIPGYDDNRLNACYAFAGMKLLDKCLENNFGVLIDGNLEVDFNGFTQIIDLMGGVDMYLSQAEANFIMKYGGGYATEGMNHLDGMAALTYTRNRYVGNGDFSRTERQRKVMTALIEKCRGMSVSQMKELVETMLPMITTDLSNKEILGYMMEILPMIGELKIKTQTIPAEGTYRYASIRGMSVLVPDLAANREILKNLNNISE